MNSAHHQRGLTAISMLVILLVAVFFGTCTIKLVPVYIEKKSIQSAIENVVKDVQSGEIGYKTIKLKLGKVFQVNMTDHQVMNVKKIKIVYKNGKVTLDARYERRVHLMFNIDVVLKFNDLFYEFTERSNK